MSSANVPMPDLQASSDAEEAFLLRERVAAVVARERASFHTPGHKGRVEAFSSKRDLSLDIGFDVTELPGLDDLSRPEGILLQLEERLAKLFGARESFISVNGASACLMASLMAAASLGKRILVPANLHRSAVSGLALSGLEPVWYQPQWNSDFGFFEEVSPAAIEKALKENAVSALLLVSPTYQGAMSDVAAISSLCRKHNVLLLVDEAHGAHLLCDEILPSSAMMWADIVVHSMHKTLPGLTQTGVLHIGNHSPFALNNLRSLLTMVQSSSPSYPLMVSIEGIVDYLETDAGIAKLWSATELSEKLRNGAERAERYEIYEPRNGEPWHVLIRPKFETDFQRELQSRGVGIEAMFGRAALFLMGTGNNFDDLFLTVGALRDISEGATSAGSNVQKLDAPPLFKQAMSPAAVLRLPSDVVRIENALGRVSSECIAPCPPGTPVVVPGQFIEKESLAYLLQFTGIRSLRVVQKI